MISREELYRKVWSTPVSHLAKEFDVSGSYLARICSALNVPRPPAGHWQKKAVGKAAPQTPLPPARPGEPLQWSQDVPLSAPRRTPEGPLPVEKKRSRAPGDRRHPLLHGVEPVYQRTRKIEDGEYLKPYKLLLPDITASEVGLTHALDFANDLFNALERKGYRVTIAAPAENLGRGAVEEKEDPKPARKNEHWYGNSRWWPYRPTVVYIDGMAVGVATVEMSERVTLRYLNGKYVREDSPIATAARARHLAHSWTTEKDLPCGRLRLVAYCPYRDVSWTASWQETQARSLRPAIKAIVGELETAAAAFVPMLEEAKRQAGLRKREWEEAEERRRRQEDARLVEKSIGESKADLAEIIRRWGEIVSVEQFFTGVEARATMLEGDERDRLLQRLALARKFLGSQDPLDFFRAWRLPMERYQPRYSGAVEN